MSTATELVFNDAVPPEIPEPEQSSGTRDLPPAVDDNALSCEVCGKALVYGGRGRKPKRCDEHKRSGAKTVSTGSKSGNEKLALQATEALVQINTLTGLGTRLMGLSTTSETIMFCEDTFREQAYAALLTDPALCKQILSAGQVSAKFSLAIAYAMLGAQVVPVAVLELKQKRQAKEDETQNEQV